jgi:capsular polysaccharide biosynthesis protein
LPVWPAATVMLVGLATAIVAGTGAAFAAEYMDPCLRTPEEAAECLQIPVLASLPANNNRRLSA